MSTLTVPTTLDVADHQVLPPAPTYELVALTPSDMVTAQRDLIAWCGSKLKSVRAELRDLRENLRIARESKWRSRPLARAVARIRQRVDFYEKIRAALQAGYIIVPNFPVDVFAVRTAQPRPLARESDYRWRNRNVAPQPLPPGKGRYVSPSPGLASETVQERREKDGQEKAVTYWRAVEFRDVEFPVIVAKPRVLEATQRAMVVGIFDQLGLVGPRKRRDPIVVGQILDPRSTRHHEIVVTFFVAWWLNTETL